ncbi:unnamed protein product, partial [Rotaria sordida]
DLLDEQFPKILYDSELNIWIKPIKTNELNTEETYERPVNKSTRITLDKTCCCCITLST